VSNHPLRVRSAAAAGAFYPADAGALREEIARSMAGAVVPPSDAPLPKAVIVPHAGYIYSGPIAASAYLRLAPAAGLIRRVVLLGPSHRVALRGIGVSSADAFATPLGLVRIDAAGRDRVLSAPDVAVDDAAHEFEHSLEVQLPFLQTVLDSFTLVPLVVGDATADQVAAALDLCWGGPETLVVVSTDLSHYHRYADAAGLDARTAAAIVARRVAEIGDDDACGARPLRGLLRAAEERGLTVEPLDLRNSGDTAGDRGRVVGYGAFALV
jgi:AmmeMemoRadiSam system protein B